MWLDIEERSQVEVFRGQDGAWLGTAMGGQSLVTRQLAVGVEKGDTDFSSGPYFLYHSFKMVLSPGSAFASL